MLAEQELGGFAPVWGMLPAMLDETGRVPVHFRAALALEDRAPFLSRALPC